MIDLAPHIGSQFLSYRNVNLPFDTWNLFNHLVKFFDHFVEPVNFNSGRGPSRPISPSSHHRSPFLVISYSFLYASSVWATVTLQAVPPTSTSGPGSSATAFGVTST